MTRRSTLAESRRTGLDDWQAEWDAAFAELVEVLSSIETCLDTLETPQQPGPRLRVYRAEESALCGA